MLPKKHLKVERIAVQMSIKLEDLTAALQKHTEKVLDDVITESKEQMKLLAPVESGELRDSIEVVPSGPFVYSIGPFAPYAPYLEFGTSKMAPQPFVRPTVDSINAIIQRAIKK